MWFLSEQFKHGAKMGSLFSEAREKLFLNKSVALRQLM